MFNYQLADGQSVPALGFGTYKLNGISGVRAIQSAIDAGYRMIDTAYNYENEGAVGEAIRRSSVARDELTVVSKLPGRYYHYQDAIDHLQESLFRSGLDHFDLYLVAVQLGCHILDASSKFVPETIGLPFVRG